MNARAQPVIEPAGRPLPPIEDIDEHFVPLDEVEFRWACHSWRWRIFSGMLYRIIVKSDTDPDDPGLVMPFIPNSAQREFLDDLCPRNVILKARQLGFTTLIAILWLDQALWHENQRVGIIAHNLEDAAVIFRDKVRFAYDRLPEFLKEEMPLKTANKSELVFAHNNSAIRVATSMRSGTIHRLHISEMGKIAAKYPEKAVEIVTGSFPAVPQDGIAIIESTAEGQDGEFYKIARRAEDLRQQGTWKPTQWRFHFFPWFTDPAYKAKPEHATITDDDHAYFNEVEEKMGEILDMRQRAWYVLKRDEEMGGDQEKMWREYPSTPVECWQQSTEGRYYAKQLAQARFAKRIQQFEYDPSYPVLGFWDIGSSDGTGVWLMQKLTETHRHFLAYLQNWEEGFATMLGQIHATGLRCRQMYVPHDATQRRQNASGIISALDILEGMEPAWDWIVVPQVANLEAGIELTRKHFPKAIFHEVGCKDGITHLANYQKRWNRAVGHWAPEPMKNDATEAADSFRQWAQMEENGLFQPIKQRTRHPPASAS